ncbi:MAG: iron-sulfur cluster assembly accessory protein, partial [Emcibacter sp.]|nr:iron-sulfur cluster assembly accessory protein [Emcibacter sp.]
MTIETPPITLSQSAAKRIANLCEKEGDKDLKFRVSVDGGGCSGFQYDFKLVKDQKDDDLVVERGG